MIRPDCYFARRGKTFQLRFPIPKDLHHRFARKELRWSLKTRDAKAARRRTMRAALVFEDMCSHIRQMPNLQPTDITEIAQRFYTSLVANQPLPGPINIENFDYIDSHQAGTADGLIVGYQDQIDRRDYSDEMRAAAQKASAQAGRDFGLLSDTDQKRLLEGVTRAVIEQVKYTRFRQQTSLDPYQPADPLFDRPGDLQLIANRSFDPGPTSTRQPMRGGTGGKMAELAQLYLDTGVSRGTTARGPWKPKTRDEKAKSLRWLSDVVGSSTDVRLITADQVRQFRDAINSLRKGSGGDKSLSENQTSVAAKRIQPNTALKLFGFAKEFLAWLVQEGYLDEVPGQKLSIAAPEKPKSARRMSFTPVELETFFSSPLFTGFKSHKRRWEKGSKIIRDDEFWLPLVLLYTGMRLGEPLQVAAEDVLANGPHPHFRLLASKINLKNHNAERVVPIHPDLVAMGFLDFVRDRQKMGPGQRLFRNIKLSGQQLTGYASQLFGRYLRRCGIEDKRVVFHSFRHLIKDVLRNAKVPKDISDRITGHGSGDVAEGYGQGPSIATLSNYMAAADFGLSDAVKEKLGYKTPT